MARRIARLSDQEVALLMKGKDDPDLLSNYFFRKPGEETGWVLDDNFDPEGAWQKKVHHALQTRIVVIGGFGSGKTRGVGISACMHAMTTKNFAFMNCAPTAYQAVIMYNFILEVALDTRFGDLIWEHPRTPYPTIKLRFYAGNTLINSKLEFMSIDKNAVQILSWEGDWVNLDEGGNIDTLGETITHLGSRLRGSINKRPRLGRLSIISNSWDNPEMWSRYDMASVDPENYLSLTVSSRHNHNITPLQLQMMLKDIPEDEHEQFIEGSRPVGKGLYFNQQRVFACEDVEYGNTIKAAAELSIPGYIWYELRGSGVIHYTTPKLPDHVYMILGDPGTGAAPNRNSPVIFTFDVTGFPMTRAYINAMWWGNGRGSITPFIRQLMQFMKMYNPLLTGVDSTGPQASTAEVINTYLHSARETGNMKMDWLGSDIDLTDVMNPWIVGYDFSGSKKVSYLVSGKMFIEANLVRWPKQATGIRRQLTNYDPEKDTKGSALAQDIVATFCMGAFAVRSWFNISPEDVVKFLSTKDHVRSESQDKGLLRLANSERNERLPREEAREINDPRQDFPKRYS
jgi:hypothetical protein